MSSSNSVNTTILRNRLRQESRERRRKLPIDEQKDAEKKLLSQLLTLPEVQSAKIIAMYLTNDGEISTQAFINWCWKNEKTVCLPVLHPFTKGHLLFLKYQKDTPLIKNMFGILEPALSIQQVVPISEINIICTPLVAFDPTGARLGMGGGFYDRTLANRFGNKNKTQMINDGGAFPIGLAHDCQLVNLIPIECWDIPIPLIVTPQKIHRFK